MVNLFFAAVAILLPISLSAQYNNFQNQQFNGPDQGFDPSFNRPAQNQWQNEARNFDVQQNYNGPNQGQFNQPQNFPNQQYGGPQFEGRVLLPQEQRPVAQVQTQQVFQNQPPQNFNVNQRPSPTVEQQIAANLNQLNLNQPLINNVQQPHLQPSTQVTGAFVQNQGNSIPPRELFLKPVDQTTNYYKNPLQPSVGPYVGVLAASQQAINNAVAAGANPNDFPVQSNAIWKTPTNVVAQQPPWWQLQIARPIDQIYAIKSNAVAGREYPNLTQIPTTSFSCAKVQQPGFYADAEAACQVYRRCDSNGIMWSFLCPAGTLFNQITLTCDQFYNVQCNSAQSLYNYSNSRLYKPVAFLD